MAARDEIIINKEVKATSSTGIRKGPDMASELIGFIDTDTVYTATLKRNGYLFLTEIDGWVMEVYLEVVKDLMESSTNMSSEEFQEQLANLDEATKNQIENVLTDEEKKAIYMQFSNSEYGDVMSTSDAADILLTSDLNGVWGIPYQFTEEVDPPLDKNDKSSINFGYVYTDRIINRMPLLIISPGKVDFMQGFKESDVMATLETLITGDNDTVISDFLSKPGKYYTFSYDESTYWEYVNAMNNACAVYLGIDDVRVKLNGYSGKLGGFNWEKCTNKKFDTLLTSSKQYLCFYTDADTTKQETFGNSTQKSQLADKVNSMSDIAKEVQFLIGAHGKGDVLSWLNPSEISNINNTISDIVDQYLNESETVKQVAKEFAVIATGGKLIFPEIWSDSEFTQSLDVKIKLRCPCPNKVSWFLDILAPLNMLIALTMPRTPYGKSLAGEDFQAQSSASNGYFSPFLVRAFYKGLFNCDMGIITDLSITKGKEGSWTIDGLPSEVDVDLTIKDLYNVMAMTKKDQPTEFLNNTTFLNYLATSCGISINKPDVQRSIDLWLMMNTDYWKEKLTGYSFWQHASEGARNRLYDIYSGFFRG